MKRMLWNRYFLLTTLTDISHNDVSTDRLFAWIARLSLNNRQMSHDQLSSAAGQENWWHFINIREGTEKEKLSEQTSFDQMSLYETSRYFLLPEVCRSLRESFFSRTDSLLQRQITTIPTTNKPHSFPNCSLLFLPTPAIDQVTGHQLFIPRRRQVAMPAC